MVNQLLLLREYCTVYALIVDPRLCANGAAARLTVILLFVPALVVSGATPRIGRSRMFTEPMSTTGLTDISSSSAMVTTLKETGRPALPAMPAGNWNVCVTS